MVKLSAGILVYKKINNNLEIFLIHPGGPLYAKRDLGVWSIPKGEYKENEEALDAAKREFKEETGFDVPDGELLELAPVKQLSGKVISAWAVEGDLDPSELKSNNFKMWGREFPEADRGEWFDIEEAKNKISPAQVGFLNELEKLINGA